jgi:hypothetical protein
MDQVNSAALIAVSQLVREDLEQITSEQLDAAAAALASHPSYSELVSAVKRWAKALGGVCRSHAGRCAQAHGHYNGKDIEQATVQTLGLALCEHLHIPLDTSLLMNELITEPWPESNRVREFVLEIANAPTDTNDFLHRLPLLPRWQPKSGFARRIAGLEPNPPGGQDARWLSANETQERLRGVEEAFRQSVIPGLGASFAEAVLGTLDRSTTRDIQSHGRKGRPIDRKKDDRRKRIREVAKRGVTGRDYTRVLDNEGIETPAGWQQEGCPKKYSDAYKSPKFRPRIYDEKHKATNVRGTRQN